MRNTQALTKLTFFSHATTSTKKKTTTKWKAQWQFTNVNSVHTRIQRFNRSKNILSITESTRTQFSVATASTTPHMDWAYNSTRSCTVATHHLTAGSKVKRKRKSFVPSVRTRRLRIVRSSVISWIMSFARAISSVAIVTIIWSIPKVWSNMKCCMPLINLILSMQLDNHHGIVSLMQFYEFNAVLTLYSIIFHLWNKYKNQQKTDRYESLRTGRPSVVIWSRFKGTLFKMRI